MVVENKSISISIIFIIISILDILSSQQIARSEKNMWIIGFILMTPIVGLIYILSGRKRIKRNKI